jgi:ligand-binding sensor protein
MDLDLQLAANCVESFYLTSGLGCVLTDENGNVLLERGQNYTCCQLCALAGHPQKRCAQAHGYGLHEARRCGGKYIYYCRMGITCFTTPISCESGAEAQITVGPFLMGDVQDYIAYDLLDVSLHQQEQFPKILEEVSRIPQVDEKRVNALAELLFMATAFLSRVSEANRMR